ncbi:hypothetical protein HY498_03550 [Candidatus Woesearchaeota archaeon]|nr:hypothetical protein [Candidatus Woesearchaeota archaeon]
MKNLTHLIIIGLIFSIALQSIAFTSEYIINDDVRASLFITPKFQDKELFQKDLLADHALVGIGTTKPIQYFYALINYIIDFKLATKILPIILFIISLIFFYLISKQFLKEDIAFISTIIFIFFSWTLQLFSGGLSRAFFLPLTTIFLYFFLKNNNKASLITIIISSFFYPPLTLILLTTYALTFLNKNFKSKNFIYFLLAIILCFLIITYISVPKNKDFSTFYNLKEVLSMEEFHENGKIPVLKGYLTLINQYNTGIKTSLTKNPIALLILLSLISIFIKTKTKLPSKIKLFALSGLILYFLSFILLFKIYIPIRYLIPVYLFLILYISNRLQKFDFTINKKLIFTLIIFILFLPHLRRDLTICENPEIYKYIETLPKTALIAGFPKDLDCIPLYSKRSVLINDELNIPFAKNYYEKIKQRLTDLFTIYYSDNEKDLNDFCSKHKVTHILVNKDRFKSDFLEKPQVYYKPFNKIIKLNKNNDFILPELESKAIFKSNNQFIIECLNGKV